MSDNQQTTPEEAAPEAVQEVAQEAAQDEKPVIEKTPEQKRKSKERRRKAIVAIIWVLLIIGFGFLMLFLASRIGQFGSILDMLRYIGEQF